MNITVHKPADPLLLKHVLLIYESETECVMQRGIVETENGQARIARMEHITDTLASLLVREKYAPLTFIPEPVVGVTKDACAWFIPAQIRPLFFSPTRDQTLKKLSGQHFPQPPLLMISRRNRLDVFALKDNERPQLDTQLMRAPYYNVFNNDSVCLGTAYRPFDGTITHLLEWEASFYGSHFTHLADATTRWATDKTHKELWETASRTGTFDTAWLLPTTKTLQSVLGAG